MRFDKKITFITEGEEEFNWSTGNYDTGEPIKTTRWANITDSGLERSEMLYGSIKQGALVIRVKNNPPENFDYIKFNNKKYVVDLFRNLRGKSSLTVSEKP